MANAKRKPVAKKEEQTESYLNITLKEDGQLNVNTNLSGLGAIHLMADATRVIVQRQFEASQTPVESDEEVLKSEEE
jgi:hypothetical protein